MDLNSTVLLSAGWFLVSVVATFAIGGFIRRGNGALDEENPANSTSSLKIVSYLQRRKPARDRETGTADLRQDARPRRRAV